MNYKTAISFGLGTAIGAFLGYFFTKKTMAEQCQEDIDSVKEVYKRNYEKKLEEYQAQNKPVELVNDAAEAEEVAIEDEESDKAALEKARQYFGYSSIGDAPKKKKNKPHLITEDQYEDECDGYEKINLVCYSDGTITVGDTDEVFEDADRILGKGFKAELQKSDLVHVRNDDLRNDYEIAADTRTYSEVVGEE